jgi:uncharacterized protein (TIGR02598 family)
LNRCSSSYELSPFISIIGLMPQGLEMARQTSSMSVESRIMQDVVAEMESTDWTEMTTAFAPNGTGVVRQYDDQGVRLTGASADSVRATFVAKIELANTGSILPGGQQDNPNEFLRRMILKVATSPRANFEFSDANKRRFRTTNFLLAKKQ